MLTPREPSPATVDVIRTVVDVLSPRAILGVCMDAECGIAGVSRQAGIPLLDHPGQMADDCLLYVGTRGDGSDSVRLILRAAFRRAPRVTVVIDGFTVPRAAVPGGRRCASVAVRQVPLLWDLVPSGRGIYFPVPAPPTGTAAPCCVLACTGALDHVAVLRGGDYHSWLRVHRETALAEVDAAVVPAFSPHVWAEAVESLQDELESAALGAARDRAALHRQLEEKESVIRGLKAALDSSQGTRSRDASLRDELLEKERVIAQLAETVEALRAGRVPVVRRLRYAAGWARAAIRRRIAPAPKLGVLVQHAPRVLRVPPPPRNPSSMGLPSISLVTPSFRHGRFLERTILSVLAQEYRRLEYVVQDGGSDDGTLEILQSYGPRLSRWSSEPDGGQSQAINRGFAPTSGEVMGWLNSDDLLLPGALHRVGEMFRRHPEIDVVYGNRVLVDEHDMQVGRWVLPGHDGELLSWADYVPQETLFWRRRAWERVGGRVDESFRFAMDWDLLIRMRDSGARFLHIRHLIGAFRVHASQKTSDCIETIGEPEMDRIRERIHGRVPTRAEIDRNVRPFLRRHVRADLLHAIHRSTAGLSWLPVQPEGRAVP